MAMKRYRLVRPDERLPFRGREFRPEGEPMDDGDAFTLRLLKEKCIVEVAGDPRPSRPPAAAPQDDSGQKSTKSKGAA